MTIFERYNVEVGSLVRELAIAVLAAVALVPIWVPDWLPFQDLPQHLAAIRVLRDFHDPTYHLSDYFHLTPFRTQYLGYYAAVWAVSSVFELETANRIVLSLSLAGLPYAMRYLLAELDRPVYPVFFVFPLLYNSFLLLGFVNFVAAFPLMVLGLGLAVRLRRRWGTGAAVALGLVAIACFFMHVVPFAFLVLGAGLMGMRDSFGETVVRWIPVVPAGAVAVAWTLFSPAGASTTKAVGETSTYQAPLTALRALPNWLTNLTPGTTDDMVLGIYGVLLVAAVVLGGGLARAAAAERDRLWPAVHRLVALAALAFVAYFALPNGYDWIWPISPRFAIIALLLVIPALPRMNRVATWGLTACIAVLSLYQFRHVAGQFRSFNAHEVGQFERALSAIPEGKRVAGLIFRQRSRYVRYSPFVHWVAHYQARKGGAVMFTFADFPQSPFRFRESNRPPEVPARWEWMPGRVNPREDLSWYDYVLIRGGPGRIRRQDESFERVYDGRRWSVWRRLDGGEEE